ncbi:hypothetical protein DBR00_13755 [Pseudomonas sp. HMWF032]|uniref:methionyl-tRNA formyltransferase n=1 Tax=Pseudomonas sp. HMWF032 TaxID=2056866 RepID=UPI000D3C6480|nr:methionyl-tRNA formyltransferase [Pseudomonas sp. HMWF032]PTS83568.1 hypothetical protein DBR00_13755 [Pseudomonas sp. HMWF032]PTT84072.1 hypothetical protein DBR41_08945 [Pseudomonas sp. HMWF010]
MCKPRVVFIGSSSFGLKCLKRLIQGDDYQVVGVVTSPQLFNISYSKTAVKNYLHADIFTFCTEQGLPVLVIDEGMKDPTLLQCVTGWEPDLFLVVGWYYMVPKAWMVLAPAYGMHASLLPAYSGGAPLVWSIIRGETQTGITLFQFAEGVDNGDIVAQKSTVIDYHDTIATVYERIEALGLQLIDENLSDLALGKATLVSQDESKRTLFPQRSPQDGLIDWSLSARALYDFIRAQSQPYPGAFTIFLGQTIRIWSVEEVPGISRFQSSGFFYKDSAGTLYVVTGSGDLKVLDWQLENDDGDVCPQDDLRIV